MAFRPAVLEPFGAPFIEAVHPVPQRLAVHATDPRGIGPAHPIQHRRKRQQTPTLVGVLGGRRKTPQLVGRKVRPHRHRCRHGTNPPAPWNQLNIERGIADESERKAVGIIGVSARTSGSEGLVGGRMLSTEPRSGPALHQHHVVAEVPPLAAVAGVHEGRRRHPPLLLLASPSQAGGPRQGKGK